MAPRTGIFDIPETIRADMRGRSHHDDPRCPPFGALRLLVLRYVDFAGAEQHGKLVIDALLATEVLEIFESLFAQRFPIARMQRIDAYGGSDARSMAANNCSAFNFRVIDGTDSLSRHALGRAVDINPVQNPWLRGTRVDPDAGRAYLDRAQRRPGMIVPGSPVWSEFTSRGWRWGGDDPRAPDFHHFAR